MASLTALVKDQTQAVIETVQITLRCLIKCNIDVIWVAGVQELEYKERACKVSVSRTSREMSSPIVKGKPLLLSAILLWLTLVVIDTAVNFAYSSWTVWRVISNLVLAFAGIVSLVSYFREKRISRPPTMQPQPRSQTPPAD